MKLAGRDATGAIQSTSIVKPILCVSTMKYSIIAILLLSLGSCVISHRATYLISYVHTNNNCIALVNAPSQSSIYRYEDNQLICDLSSQPNSSKYLSFTSTMMYERATNSYRQLFDVTTAQWLVSNDYLFYIPNNVTQSMDTGFSYYRMDSFNVITSFTNIEKHIYNAIEQAGFSMDIVNEVSSIDFDDNSIPEVISLYLINNNEYVGSMYIILDTDADGIQMILLEEKAYRKAYLTRDDELIIINVLPGDIDGRMYKLCDINGMANTIIIDKVKPVLSIHVECDNSYGLINDDLYCFSNSKCELRRVSFDLMECVVKVTESPLLWQMK